MAEPDEVVIRSHVFAEPGSDGVTWIASAFVAPDEAPVWSGQGRAASHGEAMADIERLVLAWRGEPEVEERTWVVQVHRDTPSVN